VNDVNKIPIKRRVLVNIIHRYEETSRVFYNKGLSNTFELSAGNSSKAFYEGDIADKIAKFMKPGG
jgi:gamma-glutamyltranspeptidase